MSDNKGTFIEWLDVRFPATKVWKEHISEYYAPKNFNFWYIFGFLAMIILVNQILTGIWLTMNYDPTAEGAFASVEFIMRDVNWGWLLRYMHSTGASAFFIVIYLHMLRGIMYGSYKAPRELLWVFGMIIYVLLMAEAFMGYLLPWGQMSFWGAQVIINLFGAIPFIGEDLTLWIRGDYVISGATLTRFFALHVVAVPIAIILMVFLHLVALHKVGSNNPDGIEIKDNKDENGIPLDGIPFHPYYTVKDTMAAVAFLILFSAALFFAPEMGGYFLEPPNFLPADSLTTPDHIAPVWYFTPFYAILRAIPSIAGSAFPGVAAMGLAIVFLFLLPWLDKSEVRSIRYRGWMFKLALILFCVSFVVLGYLGMQQPTEGKTLIARIATAVYFLFFLAMPWYTKIDKTKPLPERVTH
ncbi:MAG: ubiquinol-cytochrome c reductase cytochrome b subunit [Enterobacterales bacterium]|jgi:ubiquinol-cytochrome c reductase cytochrome b subunit